MVLVERRAPGQGSWHSSALKFGEVGTEPSLQGLDILESHNAHGWDGGCPCCGAMGLMCPFPEPGQGMLLGQPKGLGVPWGQGLGDRPPSANLLPPKERPCSGSALCSLLSSGFCSTYVRVKQFIEADRNKVRAWWAPAPPGQAGLLWVETRLVFQQDVGRAGEWEGRWLCWW